MFDLQQASALMCGLNGIYSFNPAAKRPDRGELLRTREAMTQRGPDGAGEWWSAGGEIALAHRRLSIIDLTDRASQPMVSEGGGLAIIYNGEIYNHPQLRKELENVGVRYKSDSDTETILHLYDRYGADAVRRIRGMFAFAIWDAARGGLLLARDPYGIKPLYCANDGWTFRFASTVKSLLQGGGVSTEIEPAGVVGFHLYGSVPEPFTLYRDIRALPAGHTQWIDSAGPREPRPYSVVADILASAGKLPRSNLNGIVREAVRESVHLHTLADVEVGLFLSAGVDSGALLGLMKDNGQTGVRAITLTYDEFGQTIEDEAPLAAATAEYYGAQHVVRRVASSEFLDDLQKILEAMDQPSIDGVNTWFVAKAAREVGLKVALSGVGGDELFGGYPSFKDVPRWASWFKPISGTGMGKMLRLGTAALLPSLRKTHPKALGLLEYGGSYAGAYLLRRAVFLPFELRDQLDPDLVADGLRKLKPLTRIKAMLQPDPRTPVARVSALESAHYMRNQLLRDADWAGMAHSVEIRTPLIDVDLLRTLAPLMSHLSGGAGKTALGQAPATPLPRQVIDRAKTGFGVPAWHWRQPGAGPTKGAASRRWAQDVWAAQNISDVQVAHRTSQ